MCDGNGFPISAIISGANINEVRKLRELIDKAIIQKPNYLDIPSNLCLDKGYESQDSTMLALEYDFIPHIRSKHELGKEMSPGKKARRWVVERTNSWQNRYRRLLVRWEKKEANYLGFFYLSCAIIILANLIPG